MSKKSWSALFRCWPVAHFLAALFTVFQLLSLVVLPFHMATSHHSLVVSAEKIPLFAVESFADEAVQLTTAKPTTTIDNCFLDIWSHFGGNVNLLPLPQVAQLSANSGNNLQQLVAANISIPLLSLAPKHSPPQV